MNISNRSLSKQICSQSRNNILLLILSILHNGLKGTNKNRKYEIQWIEQTIELKT